MIGPKNEKEYGFFTSEVSRRNRDSARVEVFVEKHESNFEQKNLISTRGFRVDNNYKTHHKSCCRMPPFSPDDHLIQNYDNGSNSSSNNNNTTVVVQHPLIVGGKTFLQDEIPRGSSVLVGKWQNITPQTHILNSEASVAEPSIKQNDSCVSSATRIGEISVQKDNAIALASQQGYININNNAYLPNPHEISRLIKQEAKRSMIYQWSHLNNWFLRSNNNINKTNHHENNGKQTRRVTFAGTLYTGKTNILCDDLQIYYIPHVSEYTRNDKRRMWYTRREFAKMRQSAADAARAVYRQKELYCPLYFRGLEHWIDPLIVQSQDNSIGIDSNSINRNGDRNDNGDNNDKSVVTFRDLRWEAIEAVLNEQDRQRSISAESNGVINYGMMDPGQIREVYATHGKTQECQSKAWTLAMRDQEHAKELWSGDTDDFYYNAENFEQEQSEKKKKNQKLSVAGNPYQFPDQSDGCGAIFRKLLTPLLDLRHGDVFLKMGEECF